MQLKQKWKIFDMESSLIIRAVHFADQKHEDHRRKDKDASPYLTQPLQVAKGLRDSHGKGRRKQSIINEQQEKNGQGDLWEK